MPSAVGNSGGCQINFFVPPVPGVAPTESSGHTPAPKRRHVKCDEARPSCQRCVKWQGFCGGYDASDGSSDSTPGPDSDMDGAACVTRASKSPPAKRPAARGAKPRLLFSNPALPVEIIDSLFGDLTERRYFDHWLAYRYRLGGGFFDEPMWNETVPQMSHQHASVRYAAMAVGGIAKALRQSLRPTSPALMAANGPHYALALSYYGSAIREIRRAKLDTSSLQAAIVCCLLFVCFEVMHGDRNAALSHINNGQKMMDELLRRGENEGERRLGRSVIGAESVETDALHVFQRLTQQSWSCGVLRRRDRDRDASEQPRDDDDDDDDDRDEQTDHHAERSWCCRGGSGGKHAYRKMPSSFATLQEARRWWDVTQHYVMHASDIVFRVTHKGLDDDLIAECKERVQRHVDAIARARAGVEPPPPPPPPPPPAVGGREGFDNALARWHDAFEPLWTAARDDRRADERSYAQAAHLRAHYLTLLSSVRAPLSCSHETISRLTPVYREVLELCGDLLDYQRRSLPPAAAATEEVFTMDVGPTWPLFLVATRCRDAGARNEAVCLLRENPRRDGLWDSRIFYALAMRNRVLEVSNALEGSREEQWWRLQHRAAHVDEHGSLIATAMDKNPLTGTWDLGEDNLRRFLFD